MILLALCHLTTCTKAYLHTSPSGFLTFTSRPTASDLATFTFVNDIGKRRDRETAAMPCPRPLANDCVPASTYPNRAAPLSGLGACIS